VRQVRHRLDEALEGVPPQLVDQEGEDDRRGEAEDDLEDADGEGVEHEAPEVDAREEVLEVLKAYPLAPEDALYGIEVLERDDRAVHRAVMEHEVVEEDRQEHEVDVLVPPEVFGHRPPPPLPSCRER